MIIFVPFISIYLSLCVIILLLHSRLIFYPPQPNLLRHTRFSANEFAIPGKSKLQAWHIDNENISNGVAIIYFGGNAEDVSGNIETAPLLDVSHVFFINLSGYGQSTGRPSQNAFYSDGLNTFDYISNHFNIPAQKIMLAGRSLGAATAIYVGANRKPMGLITITPFDSVIGLSPKILRNLFPLRFLIVNMFDNTKHIRNVKSPILIIEASNDEIIPHHNIANLYSACRNHALLTVISNTNHQNVNSKEEYYSCINNFIGNTSRGRGQK